MKMYRYIYWLLCGVAPSVRRVAMRCCAFCQKSCYAVLRLLSEELLCGVAPSVRRVAMRCCAFCQKSCYAVLRLLSEELLCGVAPSVRRGAMRCCAFCHFKHKWQLSPMIRIA